MIALQEAQQRLVDDKQCMDCVNCETFDVNTCFYCHESGNKVNFERTAIEEESYVHREV